MQDLQRTTDQYLEINCILVQEETIKEKTTNFLYLLAYINHKMTKIYLTLYRPTQQICHVSNFCIFFALKKILFLD